MPISENQSGRPASTAPIPGCGAPGSSTATSVVTVTGLPARAVFTRFQVIMTKPARYIAPPSARTMYIGRMAITVSTQLGIDQRAVGVGRAQHQPLRARSRPTSR